MITLATPSARRAGVPRLSALTLAMAPLFAATWVPTSARAADAETAKQLNALVQRMQQLEQRNQELERKVRELQAQPKPAAPNITSAATPAAVAATPTEPQWGTRLQAVEKQQQSLNQQVQGLARPLELETTQADELKVEGGIVSVAQHVGRKGAADGLKQTRINYRGDIGIELPAGFIGESRGTAVGQLRFGQGGGIAPRPTYTGTVNSTTFEATAGSDETYAVVAQAYYQLDVPLDNGRLNDQKGTRLELNIGKMDLFGQFDQNAVAADEGTQFLNNVFVHNPLLDSGGDIGADAFGFAPGLRAGYFNEGDSYAWGASLGAFASGAGATFNGSSGKPLVIGQLEFSPKQINGEPRGTYRVYAWSNGRTTDFDGIEQRHTGYGISIDQKYGREWNFFGRYGERIKGSGPFDRALTLGFEHGGRLWGRGRDAVGVAYGLLETSSDWRGLTEDGTLVGYAASGRERIFELFYRYKLNDKIEITPDFQYVQRAAGDATAPNVSVFGLRGSLGF